MNITIKISHGGVVLTEKVVEKIDRDEKSFLNWMMDIYQSEFGLNISSFSLSETTIDGNEVNVILNDKRLKYWRNSRLNQILKK